MRISNDSAGKGEANEVPPIIIISKKEILWDINSVSRFLRVPKLEP